MNLDWTKKNKPKRYFYLLKSTDLLKIFQNQSGLVGEFLVDIDCRNLVHHFRLAFKTSKLRSHGNTKHRFVRTRWLQVFKVGAVAAHVALNHFCGWFRVIHGRCCNSSHRRLFVGYLCLHFAGSNRINVHGLYIFVRSSLHAARARLLLGGAWRLSFGFIFGRVVIFTRTTHAKFLSFHSLKFLRLRFQL